MKELKQERGKKLLMEKVERIKCGNGNCYIISKGESAILVDTCREKYREKILKACNPYQIHLLILTHGHLDHVQNAAYLANKLQVPIAMCKEDYELLYDNLIQTLEAKSILGKIVLAASIKGLQEDGIPTFSPTVFLSEGDTLDSYGISASILSVPGHTKGSIAIDIAGKYLIVGDALMNMFYPTVSMLYHDRKAMLKSAKRIGQLGRRIIFFGHGKPVNNRIWS